METIVAISTAVGNGGIGIIRMSGKEAFPILKKMFRTYKNEKLNIEEIDGYTIKYGFIIDSETNEKIDEVKSKMESGDYANVKSEDIADKIIGGIL